MEKFKVIVRSEALDDLLAICAYINEESPVNARNILDTVTDSIRKLESYPRIYAIDEYAVTDKEIRSFVVKSVRIVYMIRDKTVIVLAILHARQDPDKIRQIKAE